jgi:flagellar assembly protein FliH
LLFDAAGDTLGDLPHDLMPATIGAVSMLEFLAIDAEERLLVDTTAAAAEAAAATLSRTEERAKQTRVMIDVAREEAASDARRQLESQTEARVLAERQRMLEVCERFSRDRQRYFAAAEEQVVRLALAIAARILHREAQADPALLAATVRAALSRLQEGSAAVLRVPKEELTLWEQVFPNGSKPVVQVSADERMTVGDCALETVVGRVEMGIVVQLEEITRGFSELTHPAGEPGHQPPDTKGE